MANAGQFRKGEKRPGQGRPKGSVAKTTAVLKDAILLAAGSVGQDGNGKGGLEGYLKRVAIEDIKAFAGLLGRTLPIDNRLGDPNGNPLQATPPVFNVNVTSK